MLDKLPQAQQPKGANKEDGEEQQPVMRQWVRKMMVHKAEVISSEGCFWCTGREKWRRDPLSVRTTRGKYLFG